jgi:hypothetical protein
VTANRLAAPLALAATLLLGSSTTFATSSSGPSVPSFLDYQNNGIVFVYFLSSIRTGTIPTCSVGAAQYFKLALNSTTPAGKAMLAGLIAAHAAGEGVWPYGTGDCGIDSATESLLSFTTGS